MGPSWMPLTAIAHANRCTSLLGRSAEDLTQRVVWSAQEMLKRCSASSTVMPQDWALHHGQIAVAEWLRKALPSLSEAPDAPTPKLAFAKPLVFYDLGGAARSNTRSVEC
eukprot:3368312-Amphidinium_carterae.1